MVRNWYYCAQFIAKPNGACALSCSWAATSSNLGLWANMTSSIKPEVHNISLCRLRRTEPQPQATCTKNLVKIGRVVPKIWSRTNTHTHTQTDTLITILHSPSRGISQLSSRVSSTQLTSSASCLTAAALSSWWITQSILLPSALCLTGEACKTPVPNNNTPTTGH